MAAVKQYAEAHAGDPIPAEPGQPGASHEILKLVTAHTIASSSGPR